MKFEKFFVGLMILLFAGLLNGQGGQLTCNTAILEAYSLTGLTTPNGVNILCPNINSNCCSEIDQLVIHKQFNTSIQKTLEDKYKRNIPQYTKMVKVLNQSKTLDSNKLITWFNQYVKPTAEYSAELEKLAADWRATSERTALSQMESIKDPLEKLNKKVHKARQGFYCMICDANNHGFIDTKSQTISLSMEFCSGLIKRFGEPLYVKYAFVYGYLLSLRELIYKLTNEKLFSKERKVQLQKFISSLTECKTNPNSPGCQEICQDFHINKSSELWDGDHSSLSQTRTKLEEFMNKLSNETEAKAMFEKRKQALEKKAKAAEKQAILNSSITASNKSQNKQQPNVPGQVNTNVPGQVNINTPGQVNTNSFGQVNTNLPGQTNTNTQGISTTPNGQSNPLNGSNNPQLQNQSTMNGQQPFTQQNSFQQSQSNNQINGNVVQGGQQPGQTNAGDNSQNLSQSKLKGPQNSNNGNTNQAVSRTSNQSQTRVSGNNTKQNTKSAQTGTRNSKPRSLRNSSFRGKSRYQSRSLKKHAGHHNSLRRKKNFFRYRLLAEIPSYRMTSTVGKHKFLRHLAAKSSSGNRNSSASSGGSKQVRPASSNQKVQSNARNQNNKPSATANSQNNIQTDWQGTQGTNGLTQQPQQGGQNYDSNTNQLNSGVNNGERTFTGINQANRLDMTKQNQPTSNYGNQPQNNGGQVVKTASKGQISQSSGNINQNSGNRSTPANSLNQPLSTGNQLSNNGNQPTNNLNQPSSTSGSNVLARTVNGSPSQIQSASLTSSGVNNPTIKPKAPVVPILSPEEMKKVKKQSFSLFGSSTKVSEFVKKVPGKYTIQTSSGASSDYKLYRIKEELATLGAFKVAIKPAGLNPFNSTKELNLTIDLDKLLVQLFAEKAAASKIMKEIDPSIKQLLKEVNKKKIEDFLNDNGLMYMVYTAASDGKNEERALKSAWNIAATCLLTVFSLFAALL